jgi:hypothetical protein
MIAWRLELPITERQIAISANRSAASNRRYRIGTQLFTMKKQTKQFLRNRKGGWLVATRPFCVWGLGKIVVSAGGLILAEYLQRFVAQHPEMAVQRMLAFQERKDRFATRRQFGHRDVQANIAPGIFHS